MSTDTALVLKHNARQEAQAAHTDLTVVCLWSVLGLLLAILMIRMVFDVDLAQSMVIAG